MPKRKPGEIVLMIAIDDADVILYENFDERNELARVEMRVTDDWAYKWAIILHADYAYGCPDGYEEIQTLTQWHYRKILDGDCSRAMAAREMLSIVLTKLVEIGLEVRFFKDSPWPASRKSIAVDKAGVDDAVSQILEAASV